MNPSYFSRLFKKTTGINLVPYINTIRVKAASTLLSDTDMTIIEIANKKTDTKLVAIIEIIGITSTGNTTFFTK